MKVTFILWEDARGHSGPDSVDAMNKLGVLRMFSAGMLIGEDEEVVRIAQDTYKIDSEERCRDVEVIPKKYIVDRQEYDVRGH